MALATIGLSLATSVQVLDTTIANVSLPTIAGNLGVSSDQSTWVLTSFAVSHPPSIADCVAERVSGKPLIDS